MTLHQAVQQAVDSTATGENFLDFGVHLVVNLVAIVILGVSVYYPRHGRRDLVTCMIAFNVSLFAVLAVIDVRGVDLGFGFGLFALLSIISLRSETFSTIELAYFFAGVVIGVVNALEVGGGILNWRNELFAIMLSSVIVLTVYVVDHPALRPAAGHQHITLDRIHADPSLLRADIEHRLGVRVTTATVLHTNYVEETMLIDIRYQSRHGERGHLAGRNPSSIDQQ